MNRQAIPLALGLTLSGCVAACSGSDQAPVCEGAACGSGGAVPTVDCPAGGVLHGPWSLRFDETSAAVRWDACRPSATEISVTAEPDGPPLTFSGVQTAAEVETTYNLLAAVPPDLPGTYYRTEVAVSGLSPGTCYRYQLAADPARSGRFCTAKPAGAAFRFLAMGDTNAALGHTAGVLAEVLSEAPDFAIHHGDIQLYASVFESWHSWFPAMAPLLRQGAIMPCIGNHEYENEHEFTDYYERLFGGAGFDGTVDYYRFQSGGVWFFSLNTEIDLSSGSEQAAWLEAQLAAAAASPGYRFSVVYLHRPFITLADYSQKKAELEHFRPSFDSYGVRLIFQGHVHGYERFVDGPLVIITSGGGGAALHDLDEKAAERPAEAALREASAKRYHATIIEVSASELTGRAVSDDGEILDEFTITVP